MRPKRRRHNKGYYRSVRMNKRFAKILANCFIESINDLRTDPVKFSKHVMSICDDYASQNTEIQ